MYPGFAAWKYFSIRLGAGMPEESIAAVKGIYHEAFPFNPFDYFFLDDDFDRQYQNDVQFASIFRIFTLLAILIACLGVLGLAIFMVNLRRKEIGIRKVLGAGIPSILALFSKESVRLLLLSWMITLPLIYLAAANWLNTFAFHIAMGWQIFLLPPAFVLIISVSTVVLISLRGVLVNPATSLRHE